MVRVVLLLAALAAAPAFAADGVPSVNADASGLALKGHDPVAYFTEGRAVPGLPALQHVWNGVTWRFASSANRDRFIKDPQAYAPQFGGYCAWAVSRNYTADIDPDAFEIVGGKLYLNYSTFVRLRWRQRRDENIRKAEQNWPRLLAGKETK